MKKQVFSLFHAYLFLSNMMYLGRVNQKTSQLGEYSSLEEDGVSEEFCEQGHVSKPLPTVKSRRPWQLFSARVVCSTMYGGTSPSNWLSLSPYVLNSGLLTPL